MTRRQLKTLTFINNHIETKGYSPTLEDVKKYLGLSSVSTAHYHVKTLEGLGYLKRNSNHPSEFIIEKQPTIQTIKDNKVKKNSLKKITKLSLNKILQVDALEYLASLPDESIDLIIADPPYNLSKGTKLNLPSDSRLQLPGFGGAWQKVMEQWDNFDLSDYFSFTFQWTSECQRILKPTGSMWVFGTYHNIGLVNIVFQMINMEIINEVVWFKRNAFPNLAGRRLTASHETLLWAHKNHGNKRKYYFDYKKSKKLYDSFDRIKKQGKQLRTVWDIPNNKNKIEIAFGKHPTQKPIRVCTRIIELSSKPNDIVLAPFSGAGSECVAATQLDRKYIGLELDNVYVQIANKRLDNIKKSEKT